MSTSDTYETTQKLKHAFTREELEVLSQELVVKMADVEAHEDELKDMKAGITAKITSANKEIKRLVSCVRNGHEMRDVRVEITKDFKTAEKRYTRLDTGEVYSVEPLGEDETQLPLTGGDQE